MQAHRSLPPPAPLAPTIQPLGDAPRRVFDRLAESAFRHVQLSATQPGMRPRELDQSARRDLAATLRRRELDVAGIDLWIPVEHFSDPIHIDRAVAATVQAIELAGALGRCPVSMTLPPPEEGETSPPAPVATILDAAARLDVPLADHAVPPAGWEHLEVGIDPAAWLGAGEDPSAAVPAHASRLATARLCDLLTTGLRGPVGATAGGRLDVLAYGVALSVAAYQRPVVVDARQWADPWGGLHETAEAWAALA